MSSQSTVISPQSTAAEGTTQYFLLMQDDHRNAKNKLHEQIRSEVRKSFNQTLTNNKEQVIKRIEDIISGLNKAHKNSHPARGEFWNRSHYPGSSDCFYVIGLFQLVFFEVKNSVPRYHVQMPELWMEKMYANWKELSDEEKRARTYKEMEKVNEFLFPKEGNPKIMFTNFLENHEGWKIEVIDFVIEEGKEVSND